MVVNNYDIIGDTLFCNGYIKEIGTYAGEYMQNAYDILDIENQEETFWSDIMFNDENNKIYAVASEDEATSFGKFYFKEIFDGVEGDGEIIEKLGKIIEKYDIYYEGTNCVDYSIRFIKLPNDIILIYNTKENSCYISSEEELEEYKSSYDNDGY